MQVILLEKNEKLGNLGDLAYVKSGYARNYLITQDISVFATKSNISQIENRIAKAKEIEAARGSKLSEVAAKLDQLSLKFELKAGEEDKLFGSVTSQMISDEIEKEGYSVDKKEIILEEPIKNVGIFKVIVDLGYDYKPEIKIKVSAANK